MEGVQPAARASRKRKRGADAKAEDSDDTAKKRGRPRSEKADQSAADVSFILPLSVALWHGTDGRTDTTSSAEERKSAWPRELIGKEKKQHWTTCESECLTLRPSSNA